MAARGTGVGGEVVVEPAKGGRRHKTDGRRYVQLQTRHDGCIMVGTLAGGPAGLLGALAHGSSNCSRS